MKKVLSTLIAFVMLLSAFAFTGCQKEEAALKLGLGTYTAVSATDATEDADGSGQATITVAAVLVDEEGKIVKAFIDCADNKVSYTADGKAVEATFKTKYESGTDYNMVAYGGATKEWFEQADAFCALIAGKTAAEVKALVASDNKGTEEVISAGCTIYVAEFVKAVDEAINNAAASSATKNDTLKIGVSTAQTLANATEDKKGSNKVESTIFAAAIGADGKVTAASSDCIEVSFTFGLDGESLFDTSAEILSKKEQGNNYGMIAYGGAAKEWYEQAAAFDAACIGKTVQEIGSLVGEDGKGNADVQAAGCTIVVNGFVKAASKIG